MWTRSTGDAGAVMFGADEVLSLLLLCGLRVVRNVLSEGLVAECVNEALWIREALTADASRGSGSPIRRNMISEPSLLPERACRWATHCWSADFRPLWYDMSANQFRYFLHRCTLAVQHSHFFHTEMILNDKIIGFLTYSPPPSPHVCFYVLRR